MSALFKDEVEAVWEINELNRQEQERAKHTPDYLKLQQYETQYLFIVDNMKKSQPKHWFIKDVSEKKCEAFTVDPFLCYDYNLGTETYPIPLAYGGEPLSQVPTFSPMYNEPAIVSGELFLISNWSIFESLDKLRGNGVKFQRSRVDIQIPYRKTKWLKDVSKCPAELIPVSPSRATSGWYTHHMKAWMYVGIKEHWAPLIDGGYLFTPTKRVKPRSEWVDQYYLFNNR